MVHKKVGGCDNRLTLGTSSLLDLDYKACLVKYSYMINKINRISIPTPSLSRASFIIIILPPFRFYNQKRVLTFLNYIVKITHTPANNRKIKYNSIKKQL